MSVAYPAGVSLESWRPGFPLGPSSSFKTGGLAEFLFLPQSKDELLTALCGPACEWRWATRPVLGAKTNVLVRDGGVPGVTLSLSRMQAPPWVDAAGNLVCAAGLANGAVCAAAMEAGLGGLEFLVGIPGSVGGAVYMNAGAHGVEVKDRLVWVEAVDLTGNVVRIPRAEIPMRYRHGGIASNQMILAAAFHVEHCSPDHVRALLKAHRAERVAQIHLEPHVGCAGSAFKNPPGQKAWQLIDIAGCRGLRLGGAMVANEHANFLINLGEATAADLENLGEKVRDIVYKKTGVALEWEIQILGEKA